MKTLFHTQVDIAAALRNWPDSVWEYEAKPLGVSTQELKGAFRQMLGKGWRFMQPSDRKDCETFSFITGCPGHEVSE